MQQSIQELLAPHLMKAIELGGGALMAYIGWRIKSAVSSMADKMDLRSAQLEARIVRAQTDMRTELVAGQTEMRQDLVERQTELREELVQSQSDMRKDMDTKHAENQLTVVAHIAEDKANFKAIGEAVQRVDATLIRLEERSR